MKKKYQKSIRESIFFSKIKKRVLFLERLTKLLYILIYSVFMKIIFFITIFLISNCSFNLVDDHHGVYYLQKKKKR